MSCFGSNGMVSDDSVFLYAVRAERMKDERKIKHNHIYDKGNC